MNSHFFITFVSSIVVKCKIKISSYIIEKTQVTKYMLTQIINAKILTPQGWMKDGSVIIRDNKILEVTNCDLAVVGAELFDAKGMYVVPGGVEIHVQNEEIFNAIHKI